jgi:glycosyltransferase involved in cell wall biosynthesis
MSVNVLYLALCSRDKGVIDALKSVILANQQLADRRSSLRFRLTVAGEFVREEDREEFDAINLQHQVAERRGFLNGPAKAEIFAGTDLFLFPTYYANEGQPLNLVEAMAWGLPIVTTRWRAVPEILPPGYPGIVEPRDVGAIARALLDVLDAHVSPELRSRFLDRFTIDRHLDSMATAIRTLVS